MARRPALIKLKQKNQKKSKTEQYLINRKYCGEEPTFTSKLIDPTKHHKNLSWYNYMCDMKEAREYITTYLKNSGRDIEAKKVKDVPDKWLPTTICWLARMWTRGAVLPESSREFFEKRLKDTLDRDYSKSDKMEAESGDGEAPKPVAKVERTVQDRMKIILNDQMGEIEEEIDKFGDGNARDQNFVTSFKMYDWLQAKEVSAVNAKRMHEYYNPQLEEIEEAYSGIVLKEEVDEQIKEGYSGYTKTQLKKLYGFYVMIVEDLEQFMSNSKKERKPRAKKPMTAEKKLKDFKHKDFDNTLKVQSVQPVRILGAKELWTFNVKYNQLSVFRALGGGTLDVHRTAIINFDPAQSKTKKLKAKDVPSILKEVSDGGKVALRNVMQNARGSDQKLQERMNENTLLLRVVT